MLFYMACPCSQELRLQFTRPATPRLNPVSHSSSGWYSELAGTTLLTFLLPPPRLSPLLKEPLTDPLPPAPACCPSSRTCMHVSVLITPCLQNKLPSLLTWHFQPALLFHLVCWSAPPMSYATAGGLFLCAGHSLCGSPCGPLTPTPPSDQSKPISVTQRLVQDWTRVHLPCVC